MRTSSSFSFPSILRVEKSLMAKSANAERAFGHSSCCPSLCLLAASALLILLPHVAFGQAREFAFDANGNLHLQSAEISAPPQILSQPQLQVVPPRALASFFVVAANTRGLGYQWRFNGTNISGATADTLLLTNVGATNEGQYAVVLLNSSGSVTSAPAALMLDGDRDGLPDSWELANFGNLNQNPTGDFDGDGVSNLDEFLDGTNPADSASLLFRLTVLSDGGQVDVNPSRFTYTNGEMVTLTATAMAPNTFHGWTGDTNTISPSITLVMTTNRTVFAHLGTYDINWTNTASGDWNVASNWSPNFVPGTNDNVFLTRSVTVTLNTNAACGSLTLSAGTLAGSGALTLHRDSAWSSGTMTGVGRTIIPPGATLSLNGTGAKTLSGGRILENGGMMYWNVGNIQAATATVITNRVGALFRVQSAATITPGLGGGRFDNAGTFRKTSAGTTTINDLVSFNNYGAVEIESGTLAFAGVNLNAGTMNVSAGATLNFSSGTFTSSSGSSIVGAGTLTTSSGIVNLAGVVNVTGSNTFTFATVNVTGTYICTNNTLTISGVATFSGTGTVSPAVLNLSGGSLGGSQLVTVLSQMNWTSGAMTGSGRTVIPPGATLTINGGSVGVNGGRTLDNGGTTSWNAGNLQVANGAVITNRAGALFHVQSAAGISPGLNASRFDNAGMFRKTSAGTTIINNLVSFNNYATVELQSGTLNLSGGGTHTGSFDVTAGTTLNLRGTQVSSLGSSMTGAGNLTVGGGTATLAGLVNVSGTHLFDAGTVNLTGNYICTNNTLNLTGGTANFNGTGTVTPAVINQDSGTMGGNQVVTVLSQMNWTGGTMSGTGRTVIPPGATLIISTGATVTLSGGRVLENGGTTLWTAGNFGVSGAVITNRPGALFEARTAAGLNYTSNPGSRFDNAGTFRKSVNAGTTTVFGGMAFNNYNVVDIRSGILAANGGYTSTASSLLNCALSGTTAGTGYGRLQVSGAVTLSGALSVDFTNGFSPALNDAFTVLTAGTRNGTFASFAYPSNDVTMQLSNTVNSVIVRVTEGLAVSRPVLLPPEVIGSDLKLTWTASSNQTYRVEFNPDLGLTNWLSLPGDVTTLSNTASKLDALTSSNRLYRVRVVP